MIRGNNIRERDVVGVMKLILISTITKATPSGCLVSGQSIPPVYMRAGGFYHYAIIIVSPKKCHDADSSRYVV